MSTRRPLLRDDDGRVALLCDRIAHSAIIIKRQGEAKNIFKTGSKNCHYVAVVALECDPP